MIDSHEKEAPARLVTRQDVGDAVRFAAEETFPADRLEESERVIVARLGALRAGESRMVSRTRLLRVALAAGMIIGLFSVGASALLVLHRYFGQGDVPAKKESDTGESVDAPKTGRGRGEGRKPDAEASPSVLSTSPVLPHPGDGSDTAGRQNGRRRGKSVLDAQLAFFNGAKASVEERAYRKALSKLDTLDAQYPGGPLAFESRELRARCLFFMGSLAPAEGLVDALVQESRSNRKKAELMRFLGDIQARRGQCAKAQESYRRALGLGLRDADSRAAKNGIASCTP